MSADSLLWSTIRRFSGYFRICFRDADADLAQVGLVTQIRQGASDARDSDTMFLRISGLMLLIVGDM